MRGQHADRDEGRLRGRLWQAAAKHVVPARHGWQTIGNLAVTTTELDHGGVGGWRHSRRKCDSCQVEIITSPVFRSGIDVAVRYNSITTASAVSASWCGLCLRCGEQIPPR